MGNKVCCDQTRTGGSLDNSENPPIRRVEEVPVLISACSSISPLPGSTLGFNRHWADKVTLFAFRVLRLRKEKLEQPQIHAIRRGLLYWRLLSCTDFFTKNGARPNGFGRMYKNDGGFYIGFFQNGKAHGRGAYIFQDGSYYEGEFR